MRGYRDDLATAQQRIRRLEDELARLPPKPKPRGPLLAAILCALVALMTVVASVLLLLLQRSQREAELAIATAIPIAPITTAVSPPRPLQLFWPAAREPLHADVNADKTTDLVVLLWDSTHPEAALRVAALDGASFTPLWSAGPWPASWPSYPVTLTRAGAFVVVTDSQGGIHALDLATGSAAADFKVETPSNLFSVCAAADGGPRITVTNGSSNRQRFFDLAATVEIVGTSPSRAATDAGSTAADACAVRQGNLPVCRGNAVYPCVAREMAHASPRIELGHTVEDRDIIVTLGLDKRNAARETTERPPPYFVTQSRADGKILAEGTASLSEEKVHLGTDRLVYAEGKVFALYEAQDGTLRFVARDARSGAVLFAQTVGRTQRGEGLWGLEIVAGRAYVRLDRALLVFDATTGVKAHTVDTIFVTVPE